MQLSRNAEKVRLGRDRSRSRHSGVAAEGAPIYGVSGVVDECWVVSQC